MNHEELAKSIGLWAEPLTPHGKSTEHNAKVLEFAEALSPTLTGKIIYPHQTCGNCTHLINGECLNQKVRGMVGGEIVDFLPDDDFGCNQWESK